MPIPDEAYFGTVLSLLGYPVEDRVENKEITWTYWQQGQGSPTSFAKVDSETVLSMVESPAWFARKFPPGSDIGRWGLHRSENPDPAPEGQ